MTYILLHVDDIILTASSNDLRKIVISLLTSQLSMKDLCLLNYFFGIALTRHACDLFLCQHK